ITPRLVEELLALGVDVLTSGNHIWDRKEILEYFPKAPRLLRPANYPAGPGQGLFLGTCRSGAEYAVLNLQGRVFMAQTDCPFRTADRELEKIPVSCKIRIVDVHAEATSEKLAMGWYLDGRVTAVVGTHTHVPTADERVLPNGTAYITDIGMTGPYDSVIGITKETILNRFLTQMPTRFDAADKDPRLCAVVIQADPETGRALRIERLQLRGD
ncbi:MAG: YmdB family metallophosphoesterase, partial [Acidobacteria bacterium]|nr:YmdB family metallophosphoesterase [Acidobacteriota bacterium]